MSQYSCKWNSHTPHLLGSMDNLRGVENFVDVTLVSAGGRQLKAHRLVLSTCSEMLHEMFLQHPSKHTVVVLADVAYRTLKQIVDFAYRGEVSFLEGEMDPLLKAATALQIEALTNICKEKCVAQARDTVNPPASSAPPTQVPLKRTPKKKRVRRLSLDSSSEETSRDKANEKTHPSHEERNIVDDVMMEVEVEQEPQSELRNHLTAEAVKSSETKVVRSEKNDAPNKDLSCQELSFKQALRTLCQTKRIQIRSLKSKKEGQKRKSSYTWNFFTPIDDVYAKCKACGKSFSRKSTITNLKKHLENKHADLIMDTYTSEMSAPATSKENNEKDSQNETEIAIETIPNETTAIIYEQGDGLYYVPTTQSETLQTGESMPVILKLE